MGALTSPSKSGVSGGGQRVGQGHVGEGSVRPTKCELTPLLGVALQPLRPSRLLYQQLGQRSSGWAVGREGAPLFRPPQPRINSHPSVKVGSDVKEEPRSAIAMALQAAPGNDDLPPPGPPRHTSAAQCLTTRTHEAAEKAKKKPAASKPRSRPSPNGSH